MPEPVSKKKSQVAVGQGGAEHLPSKHKAEFKLWYRQKKKNYISDTQALKTVIWEVLALSQTLL
jgi:hypothetical protein